jgi:hypothetical protein
MDEEMFRLWIECSSRSQWRRRAAALLIYCWAGWAVHRACPSIEMATSLMNAMDPDSRWLIEDVG